MIKSDLIKDMQRISGKENVLFSEDEIYAYSMDSTNIVNPDEQADVVVFAVNTKQVSEIMKYASLNLIPVTARAAGTSVCGACLPKKGGIVLDFSKMNKIIEINKDNLYCIVELFFINLRAKF